MIVYPPTSKPSSPPLCDARAGVFLHARVVLASRLIALFRIDQTWTERHLLPLFRWDDNSDEAEALWEGFLWSPRIYPPFLLSFKRRLLETSSYYDHLGQHKRQFAAFLTFAALERPDGYTSMDFQSAFDKLPQEGLQDAAKTLAQSLDGRRKTTRRLLEESDSAVLARNLAEIYRACFQHYRRVPSLDVHCRRQTVSFGSG